MCRFHHFRHIEVKASDISQNPASNYGSPSGEITADYISKWFLYWCNHQRSQSYTSHRQNNRAFNLCALNLLGNRIYVIITRATEFKQWDNHLTHTHTYKMSEKKLAILFHWVEPIQRSLCLVIVVIGGVELYIKAIKHNCNFSRFFVNWFSLSFFGLRIFDH